MFPEHQIKDHVTVKSGVMTTENSAFASQKYIKIEKKIIILFHCIFDQINAVFVSITDLKWI